MEGRRISKRLAYSSRKYGEVFIINFEHCAKDCLCEPIFREQPGSLDSPGSFKKLELQVEIHSDGTIKTYQSVDGHIRILAPGPRRLIGTVKIDAVLGYKCPVTIKKNRLQLSVLPASLTYPGNVRRLPVAALPSTFR